MAEITPAQIEQRLALKRAVRERRLAPTEAEAQAVGTGLPSFLEGYEDRHDITGNSTWWLPVAVLFYAWRDLGKTRREYERFEIWGRDLWRDPHSDDSVLSLQEAEQLFRADLMAGIVRAFGTNADQEAVPIPLREWRDLQFAGRQPLSATRADGSVVYSGVFVLRHEVVPLWLQETPPAAVAPEPMPRERSEEGEPKRRGGRPTTWDWDAMWIEVVRLMRDGEVPRRADLPKHLAAWFQSTVGDEPASSTLRDKVKKLFDTIGAD